MIHGVCPHQWINVTVSEEGSSDKHINAFPFSLPCPSTGAGETTQQQEHLLFFQRTCVWFPAPESACFLQLPATTAPGNVTIFCPLWSLVYIHRGTHQYSRKGRRGKITLILYNLKGVMPFGLTMLLSGCRQRLLLHFPDTQTQIIT